jgi:hypothetical protein
MIDDNSPDSIVLRYLRDESRIGPISSDADDINDTA